MAHRPRISIGMPAFERGATIARAIDSVLAQGPIDFELIVSDNASTDGTEAICGAFAARDGRVRYTRHPRTISGFDNFRFVLDAARAPYFMWLPPDDYAGAGLLERAAAVLDARPDVVCATPRIEFLEADGRRRPAVSTFPLLGDFDANFCRFLTDPGDNSRFYGLYRRDVLRRALPTDAYYAFDWTLVVATLREGKHAEVPDTLLVREASDPLKYTRMVDLCFPTRLGRLAPLLPFTRAVLFRLRVRPSPRAWYLLLRLNVIHHVMYCQYRYPRYGHRAHRALAAVEAAGARLVRHLPGGAAARRGA